MSLAPLLAAVAPPSAWELFGQYCLEGITFGSLIALIALGYTMVYGIIGLINFAHGDVFMLGSFAALAVIVPTVTFCGGEGSTFAVAAGIMASLAAAMLFCGTLNVAIDRLVYRPLRNAPKLAPLVSAIGVSFVLMNVGQLWGGVADINFRKLVGETNLLESIGIVNLRFTPKDMLVIGSTLPIMLGLTLFVKYTRLGKAMRAVEQNPTAAQLMGIDVDFVISATFAIGGALAGAAGVIYGLSINTIGYQIGFQNGLYAFTAAVLGGIGKLPGAVLGGLIIGLTRSIGSAYLGEMWTNALVFSLLIVILVFRPAGILGSTAREKV